MTLDILKLTAATACALSIMTACSRGGDASVPADALVSIGEASLTRTELNTKIPAGLSPADSTAVARAYIRSWIDARLIAGVASAEVDMDEINRLTEEYRNELIMAQYRRTMARQASDGDFAEDSLRAYYETHPEDFVLERPMLKGLYLKIPDDTPNLSTIRRLYNSDKPADLDRLEKAALSSAIHYDYFRDRWVDREQIEKRIPADFTTAATEASLAAHKPVDIKSGGFVYLLSVADYLPAGATMPYEAARPMVRERLLALKRMAYDAKLRGELLSRSLSDGTVVFHGSNPLT